jgi:ankyrin repeat protein
MLKFNSIPSRVYAELELLANQDNTRINATVRADAALQLAFCYSVGWGAEKSLGRAVEQLNTAAMGGSKNAMEIAARFPAALGYTAAWVGRLRPWLCKCARQGSRIAQKDLAILFPLEAEQIYDEKRDSSRRPLEQALAGLLSKYWGQVTLPSSSHQPGPSMSEDASGSVLLSQLIYGNTSDLTRWLYDNAEAYASYLNILRRLDANGDSPLLVAVKSGDFELVRILISQLSDEDLSQTDKTGATSLHWLSLFPFAKVKDIVDLLLFRSLDPQQATTAKTRVAGDGYLLPYIAAGSTALDWAMENDNAELVVHLMKNNGLLDAAAATRNGNIHAYEGVLSCAARYCSFETIKALCPMLGENAVNEFDSKGYSAFYYSIRPNLFERILRFVPAPVHNPSQTARSLETETIKTLVENGSNMQIHTKNFFNCFHVLASVEDVEIFKVVLEHDRERRLIDSHSDFRENYSWATIYNRGLTPLYVAITEGNVATVRLLLDSGANIANCHWNWQSKRPDGHSLHACAYSPWESAIPIAEMIVYKDSRSILATREGSNLTPLHEAARTGHRDLIKFLLQAGSKLIPTSTYLTPLGVAIAARSITGVRVLTQAHHEAHVALVAAVNHGSWWLASPDIFYLSAITFLLNPGNDSIFISKPGDEQRNMGARPSEAGSLDYPFSQTSQIILDILLDYYDKSHFRWNLFSIALKQDHVYYHSSGLPQVVRLADLQLFNKLMGSGKFKAHFDSLISLAIRQLIIRDNHIASDHVRLEMISELRRLQAEEDERKWNARRFTAILPLRYYWRLMFLVWVQPKRRMDNTLRDGIIEEREDDTGGPWRGRWDVNLCNGASKLTFPLWLLNTCVLWFVFLLPMVITTAIAANDTASQWTRRDKGDLIGIAIMVGQSPSPTKFAVTYTPTSHFRHL